MHRIMKSTKQSDSTTGSAVNNVVRKKQSIGKPFKKKNKNTVQQLKWEEKATK